LRKDDFKKRGIPRIFIYPGERQKGENATVSLRDPASLQAGGTGSPDRCGLGLGGPHPRETGFDEAPFFLFGLPPEGRNPRRFFFVVCSVGRPPLAFYWVYSFFFWFFCCYAFRGPFSGLDSAELRGTTWRGAHIRDHSGEKIKARVSDSFLAFHCIFRSCSCSVLQGRRGRETTDFSQGDFSGGASKGGRATERIGEGRDTPAVTKVTGRPEGSSFYSGNHVRARRPSFAAFFSNGPGSHARRLIDRESRLGLSEGGPKPGGRENLPRGGSPAFSLGPGGRGPQTFEGSKGDHGWAQSGAPVGPWGFCARKAGLGNEAGFWPNAVIGGFGPHGPIFCCGSRKARRAGGLDFQGRVDPRGDELRFGPNPDTLCAFAAPGKETASSSGKHRRDEE